MKSFLLIGAVVLAVVPTAPVSTTPAPAAPAQAAKAAAPAATPFPRPPFTMERQLMDTGGFELPRVKGRMPKELKEGNFLKFAQGEWIQFQSNQAAKEGRLNVGLTDETARTGRQCLYVHFDNMTAQQAAVDLASDLIPLKPNEKYHVAIWGKVDRKVPLTLDQRAPVLRLQIDFFMEDRETQTGESIFKVQPMPGTPNRPLLFTSERWSEFYTDVTAPEDAAYIKVMWTWATTPELGKTNGIIYFDDAMIEGEKPEMVEEPEPMTEGTVKPPAAAAPPPDAPAPTTAPAAPVPLAPAK